jgi:hypothetical protein
VGVVRKEGHLLGNGVGLIVALREGHVGAKDCCIGCGEV